MEKAIIKIPNFKTPIIEIIFENGKSLNVPVLSKVRGLRLNGKRPLTFLFEPNQPAYGINREAFMEWVHEELKWIFDEDSFQKAVSLLDYKGK